MIHARSDLEAAATEGLQRPVVGCRGLSICLNVGAQKLFFFHHPASIDAKLSRVAPVDICFVGFVRF